MQDWNIQYKTEISSARLISPVQDWYLHYKTDISSTRLISPVQGWNLQYKTKEEEELYVPDEQYNPVYTAEN